MVILWVKGLGDKKIGQKHFQNSKTNHPKPRTGFWVISYGIITLIRVNNS